jgi:hypothetical protein
MGHTCSAHVSRQHHAKLYMAQTYQLGRAERSITVAKKRRIERIDPHWPEAPTGASHPVSELASHLQGALSPFGEITFPMPSDKLIYQHPVTEINK